MGVSFYLFPLITILCLPNIIKVSLGFCNSRENFSCSSGECISFDYLCDGVKQCIDGSDETLLTCERYKCPKYLFRCKYGACIDSSKECDGKKDCDDNSDETSERCSNMTTESNTFNSVNVRTSTGKYYEVFVHDKRTDCCVLPPFPTNGHWEVFGFDDRNKPGELVSINTTLVFDCKPGFKLHPACTLSICGDTGRWSFSPKCLKTCPTLKTSSRLFPRCEFEGEETSCENSYEGTIATIKYAFRDQHITSLSVCSDGIWISPKIPQPTPNSPCVKNNYFNVTLSFNNVDDFKDNFLNKLQSEYENIEFGSNHNENNYASFINPRFG